MKTRGSNMNLRSKTVVRESEAKGQNFQHVLRKKVPPGSTEEIGRRSVSPSGSRKRPITTTSPANAKKFRRNSDEIKEKAAQGRKEKTASVERDDTSEGRSETSISDIGDGACFVYAKPVDNLGIKYEISGYVYRRDGISSSKVIGLRCIEATNRLIMCKMRARAFPRNYSGSLTLPKLPASDRRLVALVSAKGGQHNHPLPKPTENKILANRMPPPKRKVGRPRKTEAVKKKGASGRNAAKKDEKEKSKEDSDSDETEISKTERKTSGSSDNRGSRYTKQKASMAWAWLKGRSERPPTEPEQGRENTKGERRKSSVESEKMTVIKSPGATSSKSASLEGPKRSLTLLQKLRKNAYFRFHAQKRQRPNVTVGSPKKPRLDSYAVVESHSEHSSSSSAIDDAAQDGEVFELKVTIYDNKYYVMDGYTYLKERDRKCGGYFLRCVDRRNCKARAVAVFKDDSDGTRCMYGRHTNSAHSHDRSAPGHGVEAEETSECRSKDESPDLNSSLMLSLEEWAGKDNDCSGEAKMEALTDTRRRRNSLLPVSINLQQMAVNYRQCLRTLIELQDGANVQKYPALVRLVEATGEQLIEYLMDDDINGCGAVEDSENFGIDQKTTTLLNQQFKQYRALYDLFVLSSEEFQKFIDAYERWLTPHTAEMWWNNGGMLEFLSRRILRSEKYRDAYAASLIKSQGSTRLRVMDHPLLPLPEPGFLRCQSNSVKQPEMRESLHGMKATIEALRTGVDEDEESTIDLLLKEFDEVADAFLWALGKGETRRSVAKGSKLQAAQSQRNLDSNIALRTGTSEILKKDIPTTASKQSALTYQTLDFKIPEAATEAMLKPSKSSLRGIYFKYIYCLSRLCKLQEDHGFKLSAQQIVAEHMDTKTTPTSDQKCRSYYQSLKEYRAVCDFLALAPAHAVNIVSWFQKWRVPQNVKETWKSGFVFDIVCRRILRSFRYKDLYSKATEDVLQTTNASTFRRLPLVPFGVPAFIRMKGKSVQNRRMRALSLSRCIVSLRRTGESGEIKAEQLLRDIDKAADIFFQYLRSNDAWPIKPSLQLYLAPENNTKLRENDPEQNDDLFERLHQELSLLDSICVKKAPTLEKPGSVRGKTGKFVGKSKLGRSRNGRKGWNKRVPQVKERAMSPSRLLSKMEEKLETIEKTFAEVEALGAFSLQAPLEPEPLSVASAKCMENEKTQDPHEQRMRMIVRDLSHLEAVMTLEELGRAVECCQFEHRTLGLILVRQGRVVRCGNIRCDDSGSPDVVQRRVTLGVPDLPKCFPFSKIDYDSEKRTLRLNGILVDLQCAK